MLPCYEKLAAAWREYDAGAIDVKSLKGVSAPFGIYPQRDGSAMMRVRRTGGIVGTRELRSLAGVMARCGAAFAHLTSREDIQLHGVPASAVPLALEECAAAGFAFRGGGGDTFRNIIVSPFSGLREDSAFDVIPYARATAAAFFGFDRAYQLPRKLKIGFADRAADRPLAMAQDLGFVAKRLGTERRFEAWVGGGLGFRSSLGFKLHDALAAAECIRLAFALTRLFDERGCRTDRRHARVRFLREDLGDAAFAALLDRYMLDTERLDPGLDIDENLLVAGGRRVPELPVDAMPEAGFDSWRELAVEPLAQSLAGVRIFVPHGNFDAALLESFAEAMEKLGVREFQISPRQELLAAIPASQLAGFHAALIRLFPGVDFTMKSFAGHLLTCVGSRVCATGACDTPEFGNELACALDAKLLPLDTPAKIAAAKRILGGVAIAGCPNCCPRPQVSEFGFVCRQSSDGRKLLPFARVRAEGLGDMLEDALPIEDVASALACEAEMLRLVEPSEEFLDSYLSACIETKGMLHDSYIMHDPGRFAEWSKTIFADFAAHARGAGLSAGFVPSMTKWLVRGSEYLGTVNFRSHLNDALKNWGGNVGLAIRSRARARGLGKAALELIRNDGDFAAYHREDEILFTTEAQNKAARRILEETLDGARCEEATAVVGGAERAILRFSIAHGKFFRRTQSNGCECQ